MAKPLPPGAKGFMYFEPEMSLYQPFMKDPDGERLLTSTPGSRIEAALVDLVQAWRGIHYARGMPWLMARAGVDAAAGALQTEKPPFTGTMLINLLGKRISGGRLARPIRRELVREIKKVEEEVDKRLREAQAQPPSEVDYRRAWDAYRAIDTFKQSLQASEVSAFMGLYFAYENFVARAVELRSGEWPSSTRKIGAGFKQRFGEAAWRSFWSEGIVAAARHARDAYAHRGGRTNGETTQFHAILLCERGFIMIGASHTNRLYLGLRDSVLGVIQRFHELEGTPAGA